MSCVGDSIGAFQKQAWNSEGEDVVQVEAKLGEGLGLGSHDDVVVVVDGGGGRLGETVTILRDVGAVVPPVDEAFEVLWVGVGQVEVIVCRIHHFAEALADHH